MTLPSPRQTRNLAELYGEELMPWSRATDALGTGSLGAEIPCFLGTVDRDGRPHASGVGVAESAKVRMPAMPAPPGPVPSARRSA